MKLPFTLFLVVDRALAGAWLLVGLAVEAAKAAPRAKGGRPDATPLRFSAMLEIVCFLRTFIREQNHWPVT